MRSSETVLSTSEQFRKSVMPFLVILATVVIVVSSLKDINQMGFQWTWFLIRLGYLPYMLMVYTAYEFKLRKRFPEFPLWASSLYITLLVSYFSSFTGYFASSYTNGLIQLYTVTAILPLSMFGFLGSMASSVLFFSLLNLLYGGSAAAPSRTTVSNLVPLLICPPIVFLIVRGIRQKLDAAYATLRTVLESQERIIGFQARELAESQTKMRLAKMAASVAHDIRSPLTALSIIEEHDKEMSENVRDLLKASIARIRSIAENLLDIHRLDISSLRDCHLSSLVASVVEEKRILSSAMGKELLFNEQDLSLKYFVAVIPSDFRRALSNIMNNAFEAVSAQGWVKVSVGQDEKFNWVLVEDNGKGIPPLLIEKVFEDGFSYGKSKGNGLGLSEAKKLCESWGGLTLIESVEKRGSKVKLCFPKVAPPHWFASSVPKTSRFVILDDQESIHQMWKMWSSCVPEAELIHFSKASELVEWLRLGKNLPSDVFLLDFEMEKDSMNGLAIAEKFGLVERSILVTNRFDDGEVTSQCEKIGLKVLPKSLAKYIDVND